MKEVEQMLIYYDISKMSKSTLSYKEVTQKLYWKVPEANFLKARSHCHDFGATMCYEELPSGSTEEHRDAVVVAARSGTGSGRKIVNMFTFSTTTSRCNYDFFSAF